MRKSFANEYDIECEFNGAPNDAQLKSLARALLPSLQEYVASEQGQKDFVNWKAQTEIK